MPAFWSSDELEFLREQIKKLVDADVTETAWLDFFETWTATLAALTLSTMDVEDTYSSFASCKRKALWLKASTVPATVAAKAHV